MSILYCFQNKGYNLFQSKDCKIIAHLECKDLIPAMCTLNQYQIDTLNVSNLLLN